MNVGRTSWAYYNEFDPYAAEWIENLIRAGAVAPGAVDRRSIEDVCPDDLRGFRQCHFFAGLSVWSYALRRAGVSDDVALWTGSCPCQPFSAAGQGGGVDDERHLWPAFFHLITALRPPRIYGEQVASKDGLGWLDLVLADMEGSDYSVWAVDTCSAGSGAPHIRQRLRFCADDLRPAASGIQHAESIGRDQWRTEPSWRGAVGGCESGRLADDESERRNGFKDSAGARGWDCVEKRSRIDGLDDGIGARLEGFRDGHHTSTGQREGALRPVATTSGIEWLADTDGRNSSAKREQCCGEQRQQPSDSGSCDRTTPIRPGPTNGFWGDVDWLFCRDAKWRPVESGTFPLVDGSSFRVGSGSTFEGKSRQGMLKGYGNAVDAEATVDFIEATLDSVDVVSVEGLLP